MDKAKLDNQITAWSKANYVLTGSPIMLNKNDMSERTRAKEIDGGSYDGSTKTPQYYPFQLIVGNRVYADIIFGSIVNTDPDNIQFDTYDQDAGIGSGGPQQINDQIEPAYKGLKKCRHIIEYAAIDGIKVYLVE